MREYRYESSLGDSTLGVDILRSCCSCVGVALDSREVGVASDAVAVEAVVVEEVQLLMDSRLLLPLLLL